MPPTAGGYRVAFRFPTPHPVLDTDFNNLVLPLGGKLGVGVATRDDGTEIGPVSVASTSDGLIVYSPLEGMISLDTRKLEYVFHVYDRLIAPTIEKAGIAATDLQYVEVSATFIEATNSTALRVLSQHVAVAPSFFEDMAGQKLISWGMKFIPQAVEDARQALRTVTPFWEVSVEPFADNPRNMFIKFMMREKEWMTMRTRLERLEANAEEIVGGLAK